MLMAVDVPLNQEISVGGKNGQRTVVGFAIHQRTANREGAQTLRERARRGCLLRCWPLHNQSKGQEKRESGGRKFRDE